MWPLFVAIGVGFLLLLSFAWGLATGTRLGRKTQARDHEAFRAAAEEALLTHRQEREAWLAGLTTGTSGELESVEESARAIAERAHARTRAAFLGLAPAWGDYGQTREHRPGEVAISAADRSKSAR